MHRAGQQTPSPNDSNPLPNYLEEIENNDIK